MQEPQAQSIRSEFDVDIDVRPDTDRTLYGVRAMVYNEKTEKILPHPSGVYIEDVPVDALTGLCAFDYKYGSEKGFMKIDLLNNTAYEGFKNKEEVLDAVHGDVDWSLLKDPDVVRELPHIGNHFDLVSKVEPKSIEDLADVLALIRPAKKDLVDDYIKDKKRIRRTLYKRPREDLNYFKKSHAVSYAMMIVCCMYKIKNKGGIVW